MVGALLQVEVQGRKGGLLPGWNSLSLSSIAQSQGGAAGAVGIIVGMIALTSLGLKMSLLLVDLSGGSLFLTVVLVALTSLLLGMALPITASYLVLVVLAGPAFDQLGVARTVFVIGFVIAHVIGSAARRFW